EAEERAQRAISQAQLTKAGHVYVISNIGSFGKGVYKIGMTRRHVPQERVTELGDASVPFPFDVHMMISCDDAPALENALHRELHAQRVNKVNFRKEYFRADFEAIRRVVEAQHGTVEYRAEPAAEEYWESMNMSAEDFEFVERTIESIENEQEVSCPVEE
ncbi:MAG: GIY-YIG nuclease family protein, partial [Planctomycetota bacterium]